LQFRFNITSVEMGTRRPLIVQMVHDPSALEPRCRLQVGDGGICCCGCCGMHKWKHWLCPLPCIAADAIQLFFCMWVACVAKLLVDIFLEIDTCCSARCRMRTLMSTGETGAMQRGS